MTKYQIGADPVCEKILDYWPHKIQMIKAIEELNECGAMIAKDFIEDHIPGNSHVYDKTIDEIADATIMMRQMRLLYGWEAVDKAIERKLNRTMERMK